MENSMFFFSFFFLIKIYKAYLDFPKSSLKYSLYDLNFAILFQYHYYFSSCNSLCFVFCRRPYPPSFHYKNLWVAINQGRLKYIHLIFNVRAAHSHLLLECARFPVSSTSHNFQLKQLIMLSDISEWCFLYYIKILLQL